MYILRHKLNSNSVIYSSLSENAQIRVGLFSELTDKFFRCGYVVYFLNGYFISTIYKNRFCLIFLHRIFQ